MAHYIGPYLRLGFDGVAWDNPMVYNAYGAVGHFDAAHHFVRQYNGGLQDPAWDRAQTRALGAFLRLSRAINPRTQFALNASFDCLYAPMATWNLPLRLHRHGSR
jgi:hypothetical protein